MKLRRLVLCSWRTHDWQALFTDMPRFLTCGRCGAQEMLPLSVAEAWLLAMEMIHRSLAGDAP